MPTCPTCFTKYPDPTATCSADGAALVPDSTFAHVDRDIEPGTKVGDFVIQSKIGEGGFGAVYRATHPVIGKNAAVKVLSRACSSNPQMVARFVAEARAVNQIGHRNIIDIFSFGQLGDGRQYYIMELLAGTSFDAYLLERTRLTLQEAMPILRGIARALDATHAKGLLHRDLKPDNVFLVFDEDGRVEPKLLDFGLVKLVAAEGVHKTKTGTRMGTPYYMSPEQSRGVEVDARTDVYSFGAVVFETLTGEPPFLGPTALDILMKHVSDPVPRISERCPDVPASLDEPIARILAKDPAERPASVGQALELLVKAAAQQLAVEPPYESIPHLAAAAPALPVVSNDLGLAPQPPAMAGLAAVNKYTPLFELGRGGMGNVVLAVVKGPGGFNKLQVVKLLRDDLADNPEFLQMFLDEARLSARINHANVVQTNEVGFDGQNYFIAMEFLDGQSLEAFFTRAAKKGPLSISVFTRILVDACAGLHHAHELVDFDGRPLDVVHRDVSPQNIFITYDGQTKVLDFGIAKAADSSSETKTGVVKGKVAYMAPEQLKSGKVDRRADIFALGAILWRVLVGKRLWKNMTDIEVYQHLAVSQIPSPLESNPDAPPALVDICMKALACEATDRYQTAAELQAALEDFLDTCPQQASARIIGKELSELFEDRRVAVKSAIDARLTAGLPSVPSIEGDPPDSMTSDAFAAPSQRSVHGTRSSLSPVAPAQASGPLPVAPSKSSKATILVVVAAVLSVGAAGFTVVNSRRTSVHADAPPPSIVAAVPSQTTLSVTTEPPDAIVKLDDRTIAHETSVPIDRAMHRLTVEASGYLPRIQMMELTAAPVALHVVLDRPASTPSSAAAVTTTTPKWRPGPAHPGTAPTAPTAPGTEPTVAPPPPPPPPPTPSSVLDPDDPWKVKKK